MMKKLTVEELPEETKEFLMEFMDFLCDETRERYKDRDNRHDHVITLVVGTIQALKEELNKVEVVTIEN